MKFQESAFAHKYLDGLIGIEIGGSAHNPFNIKGCKNVDYTDSIDTQSKQAELELCEETLPVDFVAEADNLPFKNSLYDFVLSSHVIEHMPNFIKCIKEWIRVVRHGGYILLIVPERDRCGDVDKSTEYTSIEKIRKDFEENKSVENCSPPHGHGIRGHYNQFNFELFDEIITYFFAYSLVKWDCQKVDDKVGNGFTYLYKVMKNEK